MKKGLRRALLRRLPKLRDDTGSMPMVLLVILVGLALGAMMIPMVINQDRSTTFDNRRVHSLNAAEAGFDVALGYIRQATSGTGGVTAKLPCTTTAPITGSVDTAGTQTFSVTLAYYTQNPSGHTASWLADPTNKMSCVQGYGTYLHATDEYVPSFVLMTSKGTDTTGGNSSQSRTLQTTYIVQTSNTNITGGTIAIYPQSNGMCMAAASSGASAPPAPNTAVLLEPCETDKTNLGTAPPDQVAPGPWPWQVWSYNPDLSISLVSSQSSTYPNGLCLEATQPHTTTSTVWLQPCAWPTGTAKPYTHDTLAGGVVWYQQWSIDDSSHLEGSKSDKSDLDGFCLNVATQDPGTPVNLIKCAGGTSDTAQTWVPSPDAGAGGAGASNKQIVNFQQFGRCMDVTNQAVKTSTDNKGAVTTYAGDSFLIAYTCKQDPDPTKVAWNQKFTPVTKANGVELVTAYPGGSYVKNGGSATTIPAGNYCLQSPKLAYVSAANNGPYVGVVACPTGEPAAGSAVLWTNNGTTDANNNQLAYSVKFTVVDATGSLCLSLTPGSGDTYNGYSKTIVATCDGSAAQKWNAQANVQKPLLVNTIEK